MPRDWNERLAHFEAAISPFMGPVDLATSDPANWVNPIDRAGIRPETEDLVDEMIDTYKAGDEQTRQGIRDLLIRHRWFAWAASPERDSSIADNLRARLVYFSMRDPGLDYRDADMELDHILTAACEASVDLVPPLEEVARMSSDVAGSPGHWPTRQKLQAARNRQPAQHQPRASAGVS
jgi:hypothetical protein